MLNIATSSTSTSQLPDSWIEKLFHRMLLSYGKKFTDQWGGADTDELIAHWGVELAGFTGPEIKRGLDALAGKEWPPTLPEFKKMCRPPVSDNAAYYEAIAGLEARGKGETGTWTHPAIYWAAASMRVELMSSTYAQVQDRWVAVLAGQMKMGAWADIPPPRVLLAAPDTSPMAKAHAERMLAELAAKGITKSAIKPVKGENHRRWARKLLDRRDRGDKSLLQIQVQFAEVALGMATESVDA